jgi:hypothetical protein
MRGKFSGGAASVTREAANKLPDFHSALAEQFTVVQSRIDDLLSASSFHGELGDAKIDPQRAGVIADEELADLKAWLEKKWNATPRDTAMLQKLLKYLPGGEKLTQWSEAAPYLLTIIVAAHHAFFGHVDLLILGGYSAATWLTERLSNEVTSRTRRANARIAERFERLAHDQIDRVVSWVNSQVPSSTTIAKISKLAEELA